ncbi:hypothetical protein RBB50_008098 [Rhinocladiella similis]
MATLDLRSTLFNRQSESELLSDSSSITLLNENIDNLSHDIDVSAQSEANVHQRQKPRNKIGKRLAELEYQKVLCNVIAEPREAIVQLDTISVPTRKVQRPNDVKLSSWKRAFSLMGVRRSSPYKKTTFPVYNITDADIAKTLGILMAEFGRGTNSSFLDESYSIYLQDDDRAAICFKVIKKVAIIYGDPLCADSEVDRVFEQFHGFCAQQRWHVAVVGAGPILAAYAKTQRWKTMEFAVEQVLNPTTNSVLNETSGKTIRRTNRKLVLDGTKLHLYEPCCGIKAQLERDLRNVYNTWREDRRRRNAPQAYSAVINPFAMPSVTRYLYTMGSDGKPNSLAGLIRLGANGGYLLEPCIQLPDAPKGITGFLVTHAMGLLRDEGVMYMTFGLEALPELGEITLMPSWIEDISRRIYQTAFDALGLRGRKVFHESFYPEKERGVPLYLLFPPGVLSVSIYQAVLEATHISPREVWSRSQAARSARRKQDKMAGSKSPTAANQSGQ